MIESNEESSQPSSQGSDHDVKQISIFEQEKRRLEENLKQIQFKEKNLHQYYEKLENYDVKLNVNKLNELNDLISQQYEISHLITSGTTRLSAIKVAQALEQSPNYQAQNNYLLMRLKALLDTATEQWAINTFESFVQHDLLVIECDSEAEGILTLYHELSRIIRK